MLLKNPEFGQLNQRYRSKEIKNLNFYSKMIK
jgi:hypothetical protein